MGSLSRIRAVSRRYPGAKNPSAQIEKLGIRVSDFFLLTLREIGRRRANAKNALENDLCFCPDTRIPQADRCFYPDTAHPVFAYHPRYAGVAAESALNGESS
jgi:hypothetical protein